MRDRPDVPGVDQRLELRAERIHLLLHLLVLLLELSILGVVLKLLAHVAQGLLRLGDFAAKPVELRSLRLDVGNFLSGSDVSSRGERR